MVILRLTGGLGNQLFVYAFGLALREKMGHEVVLDSGWYRNGGLDCTGQKGVRNLEITHFEIELPVVEFRRLEVCAKLPFAAAVAYFLRDFREGFSHHKYAAQIIPRFRSSHILREKSAFFVDEKCLNMPDESYAYGTFANFGYAKNRKIRLNLKTPMNATNLAVLGRIRGVKNSVSVHIRRGDYLALHNFAKLSGAYYAGAIREMKRRLRLESSAPPPHFFIFSNDMDFVRGLFVRDEVLENLGLGAGEFSLVAANDSSCAAWELELMRSCAHHIVANSTFSCWAAWLCENPQKIIIAPDCFMYLRGAGQEWFPEEWVKVGHLWGEVLG